MAEERNLGVARAQDSGDPDSTKAELQRRMEEARESITQTVTEIKDTVTNQYQAVRDTVSEALDWREQYRKRPVAFSLGALSAGFILGYTVAGTFKSDDYTEEDDYADYRESDAYAITGAEPAKLSSSPYAARSLARPAMSAPDPSPVSAGTSGSSASQAYGSGGYEQSRSSSQALSATGSDESSQATSEPDKPGLIERFKETKAYDKLQQEVSVLGDRFIEELSSAARTVVLPALFSKVKELFGVDLSNRQQAAGARGQTGSAGGGGTSGAQGAYSGGGGQTSGAGASGAGGTASGGSGSSGAGGTSYATSENRGY